MTNKSVQALGLTAMLFAGAALSIEPAHAASATGDATVKILRAITVTKSSDLDFGKIVPSAAAATVAIGEDNSRVCGSGLSCFGTTTAGAFAVVGAANETVTVAIDNPSITLTDGGSNSMAVLLATTTSAMTLSGTGDGSFKVAGTLNVGANQAAGTYSGQYAVSVSYQ